MTVGNRFTPIDAEGPRILETGRVAWAWLMPWCCWGCRTFGRVEVTLPRPEGTPHDGPAGTTDDQLKEKLDRAHKHRSPFCIYRVEQLVIGRVYRMKGFDKVYLRAKGEEAADVKEQRWPPWGEG